MCGIAGGVGTRAADEEIVHRQLRQLTHRGPDSQGVYGAYGAVIGQTRLRIIDLVTGDPPITNEDGSVGVTLNGEIYNYSELRESLKQAGHTLATMGDTEVIAHMAEDFEPSDFVKRLNGMFAFGLWDDRHRRLVLGRDRLGKKPLYYWSAGGDLVFGSEIKSVLEHPLVPRRLNESVIASYVGFGYVPTPDTFFEGVFSLPPGHILVFQPGGRPVIDKYWELPLRSDAGGTSSEPTLSEAAAECRRLLGRAVKRRLVADVPLGAYLSGGIDSSSIVGLMAAMSTGPVRSFTIGFDDFDGFDERPAARLTADRFGTDHTDFVVKPDAINLVERLVWHHDQPFGDSSAIPTYVLAGLTRQHVTVALCGDGGDELFAGYERFAAALAVDRYRRVPTLLRSAGELLVNRLSPSSALGSGTRARRFLEGCHLPPQEAMRSWVSYVPDEWRARIVGTTESRGVEAFDATWETTAGKPLLQRLLALNISGYLLDDLLPKADRMSMAHGLEVRSPFLDTDLLSFALNLPSSLHVRGFRLKRVLKEAVKDLVPRDILNRRKRGFAVPLDRWFRNDLKGYVAEMLGPRARLRGYLRGDAVDAILAEHMATKANHGQALWTLLTLEVFLRREGW